MVSSIRSLRQQLVEARRQGGADVLADIVSGLHGLADNGYRCCLVDFESCRPAFYVRVLGFERSRVKVELEFPIEPRLRPVQWLPLSHLADYDEARDAESIRRIFADVSPFVRRRTTNLQRRANAQPGALGANGNGHHRHRDAARRRSAPRRHARTSSQALWWCVALSLLTMSVAVVFTA